MDKNEHRADSCRNGHPGTDSYRSSRGRWVCRTCKNDKTSAWRRQSSQRRDDAHGRRIVADVGRKRQSRQRALELLGARCACCGQTRAVFLQFDHINNDGAAHRRRIGYNSGQASWRWILKNPATAHEVLQVLCANCNAAKAIEINHACPPEAS